MATTNGISLAPDNLEEEVAHLMAQELPYTGFDTDTDVAVASMLNSKLDFDEALLTENVALGCGTQDGREEVEGIVQDVGLEEGSRENDSEDEDSSHYFKFSRTVVCDAASSSDASGQLQSAQSISQLDGADGGSESDESEGVDNESQGARGENGEMNAGYATLTPTKQLTIALERLESIYSVSRPAMEQTTTEGEIQGNFPPSDILESSFANEDMLLQEEVVQMSCETPTFQNEAFMDSAPEHISTAGGAAPVYPYNNEEDDKDDSSSSADSVEPFKDDLNDPDYSPEQTTKKIHTTPVKTIVVKHPALKFKRLPARFSLPQPNKVNVQLPPQPTQTVNNAPLLPATPNVCVVPRTVTSPIVLNGSNAFPIQPGATRGKAVAIRLDNSRLGGGQQQKVGIQNQAGATAPAPQVLLVNRQGQILIKDPKSNTYQSLSTNSPAYNKISQIAKILHSGNVLQRSVPRVIIKPHSSSSVSHISPAVNHTTAPAEKKVVVRVVPVRSFTTSASPAPPTPSVYPAPTVYSAPPPPPAPTTPSCVPQNVPGASFSKFEDSTAQAIIDRAMSSHCDAPKAAPIILSRRPKVRRRRTSRFRVADDSDQSPAPCLEAPGELMNESDGHQQPAPASARPLVRVKRVSSVSERPPRKKSKMDFLKDPSNELDDIIESRYENISHFCVALAHKRE